MADFCWQCTREEIGQYEDLNDLRGSDRQWGLCEGCGHHRFDDEGKRLCVPRKHVEVAFMPCEVCAEMD